MDLFNLLDEYTRLVLFGGPGCGKTEELVCLAVEAVDRGLSPKKLCFVSFSKQAAQEARERLQDALGVGSKELPYVRTLHSFAYHALGLKTGQVVRDIHYRRVADACGIEGRINHDDEVDTGMGPRASRDELQQILYVDSFCRANQVPASTLDLPPDVSPLKLRMFQDTFAQYKRKHGLWDFSDMIEGFIFRGACPEFGLAIFDEAQDLTPAHWRMFDVISQQSARLVVAGDDDQAIYQWAGASPEKFINLGYEKVDLKHSYRMPDAVYREARMIARRIKARHLKGFSPSGNPGTVDALPGIEEVDLTRKGKWLMLARHQYQLHPIVQMLRTIGVPYNLFTRSSTDSPASHALIAWEKLRNGHALFRADVVVMAEMLVKGVLSNPVHPDRLPEQVTMDILDELFTVNYRGPWMNAVRIREDEREYLRLVLKNGFKLLQPPRVTVKTIHASKGGEAENVLLHYYPSRKTYRGFELEPDQELRVMYTGLTRSSDYVGLVLPPGPRQLW